MGGDGGGVGGRGWAGLEREGRPTAKGLRPCRPQGQSKELGSHRAWSQQKPNLVGVLTASQANYGASLSPSERAQ